MPHSREAEPTACSRDQGGGKTALLIIDMINCLDFEGGMAFAPAAKHAAEVIAQLRSQADQAGLPVIYVNDNFGAWHSEKSKLVDQVHASGSPLAGCLDPRASDYFIIKPQFSGFYATNLPVLLPKLGVTRLVLTGIATDICILFTAADAHMRDYALWVPCDAVAAEDDQRGAWALDIMAHSMGATIAPIYDLSLQQWAATARSEGAT
ncbi:cysteine hydrolase family protein [Sphingomonas koreensis]